jgi:S1-C subfamily serine protease
VVQGADRIEVIFADGTRTEAGLLDTDLSTDLAVLKVTLPPDHLQPITLGDSAGLKVGQLTLAIGAPFGQEFTMTSGIISAVGRTMKSCDSCYPIAEAIQTDTPINPGNSGGPLLNERGEVIGINTWIISRSGGSAGISFALSSQAMKQVVPALISNK